MIRTRTTSFGLALAISCAAAAPAGANLVMATDVDPAPDVFEAYLTAEETTLTINGTSVAVMVYKDDPPGLPSAGATIPGPVFNLKVDDMVIVHFKNNLTTLSASIHWHGIELDNDSDGSPISQDAVLPGETYIYRFRTRRPGIFWYHPHMAPGSTTFAGMYGPIVVANPIEPTLIQDGTLPDASSTYLIGLSDIQYDSTGFVGMPLDGATRTINELVELCHLDAVGSVGNRAACAVPPGNTVLVNGEAPVPPPMTAPQYVVPSGKRIRLQIINMAITRHFRLKLKGSDVNNLYRIGGEGGLLDNVRLEGGVRGSWDTQYDLGEITLGSGGRADVVFFASAPQDHLIELVGNPLPSPPYPLSSSRYLSTDYPIAYFKISGSAGESPPAVGDPILAGTAEDIENIRTGVTINPLIDPAPSGGTSDEDIHFTNSTPTNTDDTYIKGNPGIDGYAAMLDTNLGDGDWLTVPHPPSTRTAHVGDILELTVTNETSATHPFHLHGFSFQPVRVADSSGTTLYDYDYDEFLDTIDVYGKQKVVFRVRLDDRSQICDFAPSYPPGPELAPCTAPASGAIGRWLMHCHIFHHAGLGMMSELDVVPAASASVDGGPALPDEPLGVRWSDDRLTFGLYGAAPAVSFAEIFDVSGRRLDRNDLGLLTEGVHRLTWSLRPRLRSGLYYLRTGSTRGTVSQPFVVLR